MKKLITVITVLMSITSFGQSIDSVKTNIVDTGKGGIYVTTTDTSAIQIMKNTYLMDRYTVDVGNEYKFSFPKVSNARIVTNLIGGNIQYTTNGE
jgi:hypothetical protein